MHLWYKNVFSILTTIYWLVDRAEIKSFAIMMVVFISITCFGAFYINLETWNRRIPPTNKTDNQ